MIGWNFPLYEGGPEIGINDPGIETYKNDPLAYLAREICQNSLDARDPETKKPVHLQFAVERIDRSEFPGLKELKNAVQACLNYWEKRSERAKKLLQTAINTLHKDKITFLKISDFNTTGLLGAEKEPPSDWHNLVKSVGVSDKISTEGGSFGIGKYAPFACSDLRTAFYSTFDLTALEAFQGAARLVSRTLSL
jgi:hypothetical protein